MLSSSLPSRSRRGSDASLTAEVIPLTETNDSTLRGRKGKARARAPISEPQQPPPAPPNLFSALLQSLVNADSTQLQPNGEDSSNDNAVQSRDSTGNAQHADDLFFPTSTRSLPPHPVFVQVHERLRSGVPLPQSPPDSDSEATVIDEENDPSDRESYPQNLPSYHSDEDFSRYWGVPLGLQNGRRFFLDFIDIGGAHFSQDFYPRIVLMLGHWQRVYLWSK
jgi:hypothetical protein